MVYVFVFWAVNASYFFVAKHFELKGESQPVIRLSQLITIRDS